MAFLNSTPPICEECGEIIELFHPEFYYNICLDCGDMIIHEELTEDSD